MAHFVRQSHSLQWERPYNERLVAIPQRSIDADIDTSRVPSHFDQTLDRHRSLAHGGIDEGNGMGLAAAGLMSARKNGDQSLSFLARATAAAPDRTDLLWLRAMRCAQFSPCDPTIDGCRLRSQPSSVTLGRLLLLNPPPELNAHSK